MSRWLRGAIRKTFFLAFGFWRQVIQKQIPGIWVIKNDIQQWFVLTTQLDQEIDDYMRKASELSKVVERDRYRLERIELLPTPTKMDLANGLV